MISAYVGRALSHCSSWESTHEELNNVTQTLVNNGYSNRNIEKVTRKALEKWYRQEDDALQNDRDIRLYYRSYMGDQYKNDEAALRNIIKDHVATTDPNKKINLVIYYKNRKTAQFLTKNSPPAPRDPLKRHGVVYHIICPWNGCHHSYVGMSSTRLSKRISVHLQEGAVYQHYLREHGGRMQRQELINNVKVIDSDSARQRLRYKEALHILQLKPTLNVTQETLLLPTTIRREPRHDPQRNIDEQRYSQTQNSSTPNPPNRTPAIQDPPNQAPANHNLRRSERIRQRPTNQ